MKLVTRYQGNRLGEVLDLVSCLLTLPFFFCLNYGVGCYFLTTGEALNRGAKVRLLDKFVLGPVLLLLAFSLLPNAFCGAILWFLLCHLLPSSDLSLLSLDTESVTQHQDNFTFASMNVLLVPEILSKLSNLGSVFWRMRENFQSDHGPDV